MGCRLSPNTRRATATDSSATTRVFSSAFAGPPQSGCALYNQTNTSAGAGSRSGDVRRALGADREELGAALR